MLCTGSLNEAMRGDQIRRYLKHTLVQYSHAISIGNCREFCFLFDKKFDRTTRITYQEIVKLMSQRERYSNLLMDHSKLFIGSAINPNFVLIPLFILLMRMVSLYHFVVVPGKFFRGCWLYFSSTVSWLTPPCMLAHFRFFSS